MPTDQQIDQYHDEAYFVVDDVVEPDMLQALSTAAHRAAEAVRSGAVVDDAAGIRTDGEASEPDFVIGLVAPEFNEPVFAEHLGSEALARHLKPFIGDDLRMGWVHLCAVRERYSIGWHRDTGGQVRDGSQAEEMEILSRHRRHFMKWHTALVYDPCLWIVPGSQRRFRTDTEHECITSGGHGDLPGGRQIILHPGQTIFWNGNSIHRGQMPADMHERRTLMGALIDHRSPYDPGEKGDQPWLLADNIRAVLPARARQYYDNWRALAEPRMAAHERGGSET